MTGERALYCARCGELGEGDSANCPHCGVPRDRSRSARAAGVAFVLNEVGVSPLAEIITSQQRARIAVHYEQELRELAQIQPGRTRRQEPVPASPERALAPPHPAATPPRMATPSTPRQPTDWSWLVEQQANLFLFAGAFLTVVAALIYVGYSGNSVDGSLKMALLIGYTLAFLAAGTICLRVPRVAIAGQVFFAVGALLVPLNFAAARSILSGEDLNARTLWLAGSITTATFYTAIAWLGLGRQYAFGAGVAFVSVMFAAVVRLDVAPEWAPLCFLALAGAMSLASIAGPATLRARTGDVWSVQAHVIAAGATLFVVLLAPSARTGSYERHWAAATLWFLPITLAAATLYAALPALARKRQIAGLACIAAFSGAFVSVVYAIDVAGEYYAVAFAALAVVLGLLAFPAKSTGVAARLPERFGATVRDAGVAATALSAGAVLLVIRAASDNVRGAYQIETHWFVAISAALVVVFYGVDAIGRRERAGVSGSAIALSALCASVVYALGVSGEYYAFALIAPAIALGGAARWAPERVTARLAAEWRDDVIVFGRVTASAGTAIAVIAAIASASTNATYAPQFRAFLPVAFLAAALFFAIDASRARRAETSAAMLVALAGAIVSVAYAADAEAAYYGAAFAVAGAAFALGGRVWSPAWLDERARDMLAGLAFTIAWLPFEGAYADAPRAGAGVHLAAAAFYAMAAIFQRSEMTLQRFLDMPQAARIRVTIGWLYAAGLVATIGYLHLLNSLPGDDTVDDVLRLGYPMLAASLAFAVLGAAMRWLRPEFRMHLYVMSLATALVSLTTPASAETLAVLLTTYVAVSLALAAYEDEPLLAAPAAAFGFGAIAAWRGHLDATASALPIGFALVALVAAAAAFALRSRPGWSTAAGVCSAIYAVAAPATGFLMLASATHEGYVHATPFYETALYEWSTLALALTGALMLAGAARVQRRWIVVPASAVLTVTVLLQIGRFDPENPQAYTAVIGAYFLLLGLFGLWKFQLVPELAEAAPLVEALGAAVIMLPSMIQSLEAGGGRYEWIVLAEAVAFFAVSVALRRRGMLAAGIVALVLVASRVLFDAVNALPNWVVVMLAGMALLGIGMGILLGRERWGRWQGALLGWWAHSSGAVR